MSTFAVCVFCSSSQAVDGELRAMAAGLGRALGEQGWALVYGGGNVGLMGEVARAALAAGAHVTGIIPNRLASREIALEEVTELVRTETMRERKHLMDERADAFVVLPGGIGTLEELVEILTLKQLGYHDRAIVLLDPDGFWDPLRAQLARMIAERLAHRELLELWTVVSDVEATIEALRDYEPPPTRVLIPADLETVEAAPDELGA